jgi:valyl-tRNA synthetase
LEQDPDVLDTWFSSGQLPFTALGWPEATADLAAFYPTSLLITGFDILFLWVARGMIMLSCWFMSPPHRPLAEGEKPLDSEAVLRESVPFREVYIHALVRDADRQKMSKTKGNVLDPIEVIEKYGTDATRFTLASMSSPGTDIAFNPSRTEGYRAFANKIWNAARFMFMNVDRIGSGGVANGSFKSSKGISGFAPVALEDRWILSRFNRVAGGVDTALRAYRFDDAARAIYDFFWGELCDWYIELIKPRLLAEGEADGKSARASCANLVLLFEASLRLLHPIMPFITEEIWHAIYDGEPPLRSIALAAYPQIDSGQVDGVAENDISILQDVIINIRNLRAELKVEQKVKVPVQIYAADSAIRTLIQQNQGAIERLANVDSIAFSEKSLANLAGARGTTRFDVLLIYEKKIDAAVERERLRKDLDRYEKEISNGQRQLQNEQFLAKAPKQVVEGIRKRAEELEILIRTTRSKLDGL